MEDSPSKKRRKATFREVGASISKEELVRRLKTAAQGLASIDQGESTEEFDGFSASLASSFIFYHKDKDVKSYAACCFADILRIYAPEPPYNEDQLKDILSLLVDQLKGLDSKDHGPSYKRNFYILESLALVKTFNVSLELDAQDVVLKLFKLFISIVSDAHNARVTSFMLDIMAPLIQEGDSLPPELLHVILSYLVNPKKTKKPHSWKLVCDLIERCSTAIEPYIQVFFNNALVLGNSVDDELDENLYDLMYELYSVNRTVLMSVLPQLEFKLKGNEEEDRLKAVKLLGQMFSSEDTSFAETNKLLWNCYLGRFRDISADIRIECIRISRPFLTTNSPQIRSDITVQVCDRILDADEKVRAEVLHVIFEAAIENFDTIDKKVIEALKDRMRDKKWAIRREAITYIGKIYKKVHSSSTSASQIKKIAWAPTKVLHQYYINNMDDRLCIERVVHGCLIPVILDAELRMKRLFLIYSNLDNMAMILFDNMLQQRAMINKDFNELLTTLADEGSEDTEKIKHKLMIMIAKALPDPLKVQEHLKKLSLMLSDAQLFKLFKDATDVSQECPKIIKSVSEIVKKVTKKSPVIDTVKSLLDRACPMLVDKSSFVALLKLIRSYLDGFGEEEDDENDGEEDNESDVIEKGKLGLKLVQVLAKVRPSIFQTKQAYEVFLLFLKHKDKDIIEQSLQCLTNVIGELQNVDKSLYSCYKPVLNKLVVTGSSKQSKLALRCFHTMLKDSFVQMERLFNTLVENLNPEENYYTLQATISALGEIAVLAPKIFENKHQAIVRDFIVKKVMVIDRETTASSHEQEDEDEWGPDSHVSEETFMKVQAIKLLVKWLLGLGEQEKDSALPVLRLLCALLKNDGDLSGNKKISSQDKSRLRLAAGCAMLKLAQQVKYVDVIELDHYQQIALVIQDSCFEVREKFTAKLHKGLETLRLPPDYLAILGLVAVDPSKERRNKIKQLIIKNAQTRRDYSSQHSVIAARPFAVLPEYSLPYLVHMLAHHPDFDHKKNKSLHETKEYLWFFLEPIMGAKAENYSFLKKLLENIKRTKDKQDPDDLTTNEKLYAVCDLAIACIMQKTQTFTLKDFPGNVVLPKKLFIAEKNTNNTKSYLPKGFILSPKKQKSISDSKIVGKKVEKKVYSKRALPPDENGMENESHQSPPKKSRIGTGAGKGSSTKKQTSAKKQTPNTPRGTNPADNAKRNLNAPLKKSPKKASNTPVKKSPKKASNSSPKKSNPQKVKKNVNEEKSPVKKTSTKKASPAKRTSVRGKKTKVDSFVNGNKYSEEDQSDQENEGKFTAVIDEKPQKQKSISPSPKKGRNVRMAQNRSKNMSGIANGSTSDSSVSSPSKKKNISKLQIRRKARTRR